jgi:hypothetical protein
MFRFSYQNPATFVGSSKPDDEDVEGVDGWGNFESGPEETHTEGQDQSKWRVAVEWVDGDSAEAQEAFGDNWDLSYPIVNGANSLSSNTTPQGYVNFVR